MLVIELMWSVRMDGLGLVSVPIPDWDSMLPLSVLTTCLIITSVWRFCHWEDYDLHHHVCTGNSQFRKLRRMYTPYETAWCMSFLGWGLFAVIIKNTYQVQLETETQDVRSQSRSRLIDTFIKITAVSSLLVFRPGSSRDYAANVIFFWQRDLPECLSWP